jgi:hypothetical protein
MVTDATIELVDLHLIPTSPKNVTATAQGTLKTFPVGVWVTNSGDCAVYGGKVPGSHIRTACPVVRHALCDASAPPEGETGTGVPTLPPFPFRLVGAQAPPQDTAARAAFAAATADGDPVSVTPKFVAVSVDI